MVLWNHRSPSQQATPISSFVSILKYPKALPIHERRWQLITRVLDADVIRRNMGIFVRAMLKTNFFTFSGTGCDSILVSPEVRVVLGLASPVTTNASSLAPRFYLTTETFRATDYGNPSNAPRGFLGTDPLNDFSYIENVIAKYTAKYTKQRKKGLKPMSQPPMPTHNMSRRSQAPFKTGHVFLPAELILNITDYLEYHKDIQTLLSVFPHWYPMIPDSCWKRRFIDYNCLDDDQFPAVDALDCQHVYFNTDRLFRPSLAWGSRQYILSQLGEVKGRFLRQLMRNDFHE
ncbi:hypothetical protein PDIG_69500 [Penicillium digitatum PHI26]|uniref:F-box domain-containing protein n=2 Tax=Penicillium digitatum TaxID=36651 RepID=K9FFE0_PEND2|nr:hypothetical protein PDIP_78790 [Penicillium digitatum Pd1]EKV06437.1 hypothetical protein PDIP_78790 [Penicillium digitatum Pd1]EKV08185.1 hypothetical protein PDIG_69500 [Penicillium digitatum PHI26]